MADVELLPLPEWTKRDDLGGLVPSEVRSEMHAYTRANMEPLRAENERLRAEVAEWKRVAAAQAELHGEAEARTDKLAKALRDAATSMQTIADKAGRDEYLMTTYEVRCYANSRANAARTALAQEDRNG